MSETEHSQAENISSKTSLIFFFLDGSFEQWAW